MDTKTCWCCKEERLRDEFYKGQTRCKLCSNRLRSNRRHRMCFRGCTCDPCARQREIDREHSGGPKGRPSDYPSQRSTYRRATRRGLTVEQVEAMHVERNNRCDICGKEEVVRGSTGKVKSLAIDHNGETGYVRGLLCNNCNRGLGLLGHDPELLVRATDHLLREYLT